MKKSLIVFSVLSFALLVVPFFRVSANAGIQNDFAGRKFGEHHSAHAQDQHFDGEMNPGTHKGFSGWEGHEGE